jgi:hypothetical protein
MSVLRLSLTLLVCSAVACRIGTSPSPPSSGIQGRVLRGPVTPVCIVDQPCYAPFAATFLVQQRGVTVTVFRSDSGGRFLVHLAPGAYTVVPGPDAPILSPASQARSVEVQADSLTSVELTFDTGIR